MIAVLLPLLMFGQVKQINDLLDKYEKKKNIESILVSPMLLQLAEGNSVDLSTKELLSKISQLRILNIRTSAMENGFQVSKLFRADLDKLIDIEKLNKVARVQNNDELLEMYITENTKGALLFLTTGPKEFSIITIFGEIDKSVINAAISGKIRIK